MLFPIVFLEQLLMPLLLSELLLDLLQQLVLLELFLLFEYDLVLERRQVRTYFHLDLLLGHVLELLILIVKWQPFRVVDIAQLIVLPPVILLFALLPLAIVGLQVLLKGLILAQAGVKPILDVVVNSTWHVLLNLHPFVAVDLVELHQLEVLGDGPFLLVEVWIDIVIPSLPALLSDSAR